jgi:hypothetical protein
MTPPQAETPHYLIEIACALWPIDIHVAGIFVAYMANERMHKLHYLFVVVEFFLPFLVSLIEGVKELAKAFKLIAHGITLRRS